MKAAMLAMVLLAWTATTGFAATASTSLRGSSQDPGYDMQMCISTKRNFCVNEVCVTSEDIDCQENCLRIAEKKCEQELSKSSRD